jgi:hypothetical protein
VRPMSSRTRFAILSAALGAVLACSSAGHAPSDAARSDGVDVAVSETSRRDSGGGDSDPVASYIATYARSYCHRVFECCAAADVRSVYGATDRASCVDEASCVIETASELNGLAAPEVADGIWRFDESAASKCLSDLQGACSTLFDPHNGDLVICNNVFSGAVPLGGHCVIDFDCVSGACPGSTCVTGTRPPCATMTMSCGVNEFCDLRSGCQPVPVAGAPCPDLVCADGLACVAGECGTPRADGQSCTTPTDCSGACALDVGGLSGVCRPAFCQGTGTTGAAVDAGTDGSTPSPSGPLYHCSLVGTSLKTCMEFSNVITADEVSTDQATCGTNAWATGPCPTTGILGGCRTGPNQVQWYYTGGGVGTPTNVMAFCSGMTQTFVCVDR